MTVKKKNINQKISSIAGWNPLPLSLKIFFIILSLGVISSIFSIGKNWYFLLGFIITGFVSKIILFLLNIAAPIMLLIAMWKRYSWTKRYAFVYLGFFILNNIIGIWNFFNVLPKGSFNYFWISFIIGIIFTLLMIFFIFIFYKKGDYFEK